MLNCCNKRGCGCGNGHGYEHHHGHVSHGVYHGGEVQMVSQVVGFQAAPLIREGIPGDLRFMDSFVEPVLMQPVMGIVHRHTHHEHHGHDGGRHGHNQHHDHDGHHEPHVHGCRCDRCHSVSHTRGPRHHSFVKKGCGKVAIDMRSCRAKRSDGQSCY